MAIAEPDPETGASTEVGDGDPDVHAEEPSARWYVRALKWLARHPLITTTL